MSEKRRDTESRKKKSKSTALAVRPANMTMPMITTPSQEKGLKELTDEWMQLERKTLEQRKNAARFYDEHLMKPIEAAFVRNNQDMVFEDIEYMVISVGTSYEPIVLDIRLLQPAKILFLYTETSRDTMAKVIGYCELDPNRYDKSLVSEVDPMDIYREIKSFYLRCGKPGKMYIDFTGGTKAMSAAAALAGAMIDVQMVYCSTDDYLVDFRKPNPGSERLIYIENPLAVFGELEIEKAFELFDKSNFAGAKEKFSVLKENLPEPSLRQQLSFVWLLAAAYEAWDALDFVPAYGYMLQLQREIERDRKLHHDYLLMDYSMHIDRQRAMLENLQRIPSFQEERNMKGILEDADILHSLALTLYQNAKTRERQEKFDMATLLLYRLLEMMSQRRLMRYGIFASRPDYRSVKYNLGRLFSFLWLTKERTFCII
jgi:CRISPR-associated protein (TIGR02710 family)